MSDRRKPFEINDPELKDVDWNIAAQPAPEQQVSARSRVVEYTDLVKKPLKEHLLELARAGISYLDMESIRRGEPKDADPSHDYPHTARVMTLAEIIARRIRIFG